MSGKRCAFGLVIGLIAAGAAISPQIAVAADNDHFSDADNRGLVVLGKRLYAGYCAGCHGRYLQGQPLWQLRDAFAGRRAPALDESGSVWQHSDEQIFALTQHHQRLRGAMPVYNPELDDGRILAIIAFVKARWPLGLRIVQAMRNPGLAGMPANARDEAWQLPANCNAILQRNEAAAQQK
jgi:mono/diheme cytochrome c family protein